VNRDGADVRSQLWKHPRNRRLDQIYKDLVCLLSSNGGTCFVVVIVLYCWSDTATLAGCAELMLMVVMVVGTGMMLI